MTDRWLPPHFTRPQLEERRLPFLHLLEADQHTTQELAEFLGVSMGTTRHWN
ncbi:helix-turn-helix domain-containing protein [Deinococcus sp. Arct2-2]|uniref:helix-turn-helix domain-containing protein n=1 Tax=Deinococcus sp. Arct2-2 TaxID=2568653 RepID=UPI001454D724|nr:helix-turn-helix domain-containing protein [Deinococcus sp. Arct2-2]